MSREGSRDLCPAEQKAFLVIIQTDRALPSCTLYNKLNLDTLTIVFRRDARLTVDGETLVGVVSALQGNGRDCGRVAGDDLHWCMMKK